MNRFRGPIGLLSAWLLVVAVGSAMVWTVISRAGDDLVAASNPSFRASASAEAEEVVASTTTAKSPDKPQATGKPTVIKTKKPSPSPKADAAPTPSPTEAEDPASASPTDPDPTSPAPSSPNNDDDDDDDRGWGDGDDDDRDYEPPAVVRSTWQGAGGLVIAECKGWAISLVGAPAESGYHVAVWSSGPRRIRVNFEVQDGSGERTEVFGACRRGTPAFFARTGDGSWGDDDDENE